MKVNVTSGRIKEGKETTIHTNIDALAPVIIIVDSQEQHVCTV